MRTLPVTLAFRHAVNSMKDNVAFAFHISWPWMLFLLPLNIFSTLYLLFNDLQLDRGAGADPAKILQVLPVSAPLAIISIVAYTSIAVNWHRYVLLDEVPQGWARLRLDGVMMRYMWTFVQIFLVIMVAAILASVVFFVFGLVLRTLFGAGFTQVLLFPIIIPLYLYSIVATYRLSLTLPATALGRQDFGLRDAWDISQGNNWQILGVLALMILGLIVVAILVYFSAVIFSNFGAVGLSISIAIQVLVNWLATIFGVTLITSLYGFFVEKRNF